MEIDKANSILSESKEVRKLLKKEAQYLLDIILDSVSRKVDKYNNTVYEDVLVLMSKETSPYEDIFDSFNGMNPPHVDSNTISLHYKGQVKRTTFDTYLKNKAYPKYIFVMWSKEVYSDIFRNTIINIDNITDWKNTTYRPIGKVDTNCDPKILKERGTPIIGGTSVRTSAALYKYHVHLDIFDIHDPMDSFVQNDFDIYRVMIVNYLKIYGGSSYEKMRTLLSYGFIPYSVHLIGGIIKCKRKKSNNSDYIER